jgi:MFS family permease
LRNEQYPKIQYAWYTVVVLQFAYSVAYIDRLVLSLMVQPIRADLHLSDTGISLLHGFAFAIFYSVVGIAMGRWVDRHHRQRLLVGGIVLWCLATAACGLARNFHELFLARLFVGLGEAALGPASYSLIADSFPKERRGKANGVYSMGIYIGSSMALFFGGAAVHIVSSRSQVYVPLLGSVAPWRAAFLLVGLPGLLAAMLMLTVREPTRKEVARPRATFADFLRFFRKNAAAFWAVIGPGCGVSLISFSLSAWLPTVFVRQFGWTTPAVATAYGTAALTAGCGGVVLGGILADRAVAAGKPDGAFRVLRLGIALLVPFAAWVTIAPTPAWSLAFLALNLIFLGMVSGQLATSLNVIVPNEFRGQTLAIALFFGGVVGQGLGPTLVALTTDYVFHNDHAVGQSVALVALLAAVLGFIPGAIGSKAYRQAASDRALPARVGPMPEVLAQQQIP